MIMERYYNVIAVQDNGVGNETTLGEYDTLEEAEKRVREVHDRGHMIYYTKVDIVEVKETLTRIKDVKSTVVQTTEPKDPDYECPVVPSPTVGLFHPDYERQGLQTVEQMTADYEELRDTVYHLEDRHVGLRHELSTDMEMLEDSLEELKDNLAEDLRDLRMELEEMRGRTQR